MTQPFKICPQCQEAATMSAASCARCGRVYRTTAPPSMQQTQVIQPPQYQQPPYPPQYPPQAPPPTPYSQSPPTGISVQPGYHSPMVAVLWGFLCCLPFGQFYNKQYAKGLVMLLVFFGLAFFTYGLAWIIAWPLALMDAYRIADRLNRGETVGEWQSF